jgi:CBS domain containing-hemolysin-like protein
MVHRADIVAVKRDIALGELMSLFESAAHSRLVVTTRPSTIPKASFTSATCWPS